MLSVLMILISFNFVTKTEFGFGYTCTISLSLFICMPYILSINILLLQKVLNHYVCLPKLIKKYKILTRRQKLQFVLISV